jgi:hypothetical protein
MSLDYYEILGVPSDASMQEIKNAYRRRAVACHPDRGGSHEKMLLINEAWEVLSDPSTRMHYDAARSNRYDYEAQHVADEEKAHARTRAQTYPRNWNDFAAWLDCFVCDFTAAEYIYPAQKTNGWLLFNFPTVRNSISGKLFCFCGAVAGILVASFIVTFPGFAVVKSASVKDLIGLCGQAACGLLPPLGAIAGCILHKKFARILKPENRQQPS